MMNPLPAIVLAPAIAALLIAVLRRGAVSWALAGAAVSLAGALLLALGGEQPITAGLGHLGPLPLGLAADRMDAIVLAVVTFVSFCVFVYAIRYMRGKGHAAWFWSGISLFLAGMTLLVLAADWLVFLAGWEIMGCASFLLIATEHEESEARQGAVKAFLMTRTPDLGLYLGIFAIFAATGSLAIDASATLPAFAAAGLLVAAMGKSAQLPFQSWLSGAMAGPTPVSALLHSATMVAAGALLLIQAYPLMPPGVLAAVAIVGGTTAVLAGFSAIAARDIKQMLASSTSSQLGLMFLAIGTGFPGAALAHWLAHALMKSTLFLTAGHFQERFGGTGFDRLGGSARANKTAYALFLLAGLALAGLPPLVGYFSKDAILAATLRGPWPAAYFTLATAGAAASAIYIGRAARLLFHGAVPQASRDSFATMTAATAVLATAIVVAGFGLHSAVTSGGLEMPESPAARLAGIAALVLGVGGGWWLARVRLHQIGFAFARRHYRIAGGYRAVIVAPVDRIALWAGRFDRCLADGVNEIGTFALSVSRSSHGIDRVLSYLTLWVGRSTWFIADSSKLILEEDGLAKLMDRIADGVRRLGEHGRTWQSGMAHKEMLITLASSTVVLAVFIGALYFT
ncbi:NADH-quinone oxidoreductase subunit 5 family protein [Haloferula sargassicola]|uniref:NAD(P)H-quinone oxidoreductase subunit 2, chloroplastic n=1 Tax=Haloferula sargassicola TaxID=490096 RepID=A0ABP9UJT7_9BACT